MVAPSPDAPVFLTLRATPALRAALDALAASRGTTRHRAALDALAAGVDALPRVPADLLPRTPRAWRVRPSTDDRSTP